MIYPISCVLIIPNSMQAKANAIIEGYGYGPGNLSVEVSRVSDGSAWRGCHVWCDQAFVDFIAGRQAVDFLGKMIVSAGSGPANTNWSTTLSANGMKVPPEQT